MQHYSKIIKDQIDNDERSLHGFYDGYIYRDNVIVQGSKSIGINYQIDPENGVQYDIKYFNEDEDSLETVSLEQIDELFTLTVEEYIDFLQGKLCSYESGINEDGYWYIETGDRGWMGFEDGQYVIAAYGNMRPCEILNELLPEHVTNHSKALKRWDGKQEKYILMQ